MATVRISGNWRNPNKMELGGTFPLDKDGHIERGQDIPEEGFQKIERAIAQGNNEGAIYQEGGTRFQWLLDR